MDNEVHAVLIRMAVSNLMAVYRRSKNPDSEESFLLGAHKWLAIIGALLIGLLIAIQIVEVMYQKWQSYWAWRRIENEEDEEYLRHRDNFMKRVEGALQEPVHECPICLGDANFPVFTNCGHLFCCSCIIRYWKQSKSISVPCKCAYCRSTFYVLIPILWPAPGSSDEIDEQIQKNNVDLEDYNKRFSSEKSVSRLESILFYGKKFMRLIWIDIVRLVVMPVCANIYAWLSDTKVEDSSELLQSIDNLFLSMVFLAASIRVARIRLAG
ncbi:hypothetical protein CAEBREN_17188 [Caenorhabditis brenneri]|uniref:RING-type domain-containing protein n=1 Tax=Caenorhabditis brenneri TaxID=135651 RepID=G0MQB3_CAEBE|nr:hypothetical protein CAEBREN_17188 [Caenorhabditis brenneri]